MKVLHWVLQNGSGMARMAEELCAAECGIGLESELRDPGGEPEGADIHVIHTNMPEGCKGRKVFVAHGTPEHCFELSVRFGLDKGHYAADPWMLSVHRTKTCDATVTFWERHRRIWSQISDRVWAVPMGVDKSKWHPVESKGRFVGEPSFLVAENCHAIKWPLNICLNWNNVRIAFPKSKLHIYYLPTDQHRYWFPMLSDFGILFDGYASSLKLSDEELRNAFCSVDYYISPVRFGDHNRVSLEASACGCKVIGYKSIEHHADFEMSEEMEMKDLVGMIGKIEKKASVPDIKDTAQGMKAIYESL